MKTSNYLGIMFRPSSKKDILEKIFIHRGQKSDFIHVVSLNPENMVIAQHDREYRNILSQSDLQIVDGIGTALGSRLLGFSSTDRITGVDLMEEVIKSSAKTGLRILLLGGKPNLAEHLANCYKQKYPHLSIKGKMGFKDILALKKDEEKKVLAIVADYRPQIIFAAFGSPTQEKWFYANRKHLFGSIGIGVGGAFDFLAGETPRAPQALRSFGFEWLYRLIVEPWRFKRQLRLITFIYLVCKQKFGLLHT